MDEVAAGARFCLRREKVAGAEPVVGGVNVRTPAVLSTRTRTASTWTIGVRALVVCGSSVLGRPGAVPIVPDIF
ncbi:hypothetical protein ACF1BP_32825 [Streptomyces sp. NPDC014735]|uniref:hypothetical protein n=1 Tax=unclassified Streptomyces TaxID=2593676 RepID=UPI0036FBA94B